MIRTRRLAATAILLALAAPALAKDNAKDKDENQTPPPVFQAVLDCKALADPAARLDCYDRAVGAMANASADAFAPPVLAAQQPVDRDSFGLNKPREAQGGGEAQAATITAITLVPGVGEAVITLDNGQIWRTTSNGTLVERLRGGQKVIISRTGMFGYRLRIEGRTGFQSVVRIK